MKNLLHALCKLKFILNLAFAKDLFIKTTVLVLILVLFFTNGHPMFQTLFPIPNVEAHTLNNLTTASRAAGSSSTTFSFSHNNPSGTNVLVIGVVDSLGTSPNPTVTFNGVSATIVGAQALVTGLGVRMYYLDQPPVGNYTVQITHSASVGAIAAVAASYNVDTFFNYVQLASQLGSGTCPPNTTFNPGTSLGLEVFGARGDKDPVTWSPSAPATALANYASGGTSNDVTLSFAQLTGSTSSCVSSSGSVGFVRRTIQNPGPPLTPQPPTITSTPPTSAITDTQYSYAATATDPNSDPLTWSLITAPAGMTVDSGGLVTWTPSESDVGDHNVTLEVDDNVTGTDEQSWVITVSLAGTMSIKAGSVNTSTSGGSVSFTADMPSIDYSMLLTGGSDSDTMYSLTYLSQSTSGFDVKAEDGAGGSEASSNNQWAAITYGDFDIGGHDIKCDASGGSAGNNTISFASAFPDTSYSILATSADDSNDSPAVNFVSGSKQTDQVTIRIEDDGGATESVPGTNYCAVAQGEYSAGSANIKAGSNTTVGSGDTSVSFLSAFPDTNYTVVAMAEATNGSLCVPEVVSKSTGSFTIHFEDDAGSNCGNKLFDWVAITTGEFDIAPGGGGGGGSETQIILTSGSSWTVPDDWNPFGNTVECIGAGGTGVTGTSNGLNYGGGGGGGGGAYSKISNLFLTAGNSITYNIAPGGDNGTNNTYFNGTNSSNSSISCDSGRNGINITGGVGGLVANSIGSIKYAGGDGGNGYHSVRGSGGGGGGSAGPTGVGRNGANTGSADYKGGGGGGGSNGGSSSAGSTGSGNNGGNGGGGTGGTGGGNGGINYGVSRTDGTNGGGGGGGALDTSNVSGGSGGMDMAFDTTHGASGGGGGGPGSDPGAAGAGGAGGTYGGGGGGGGADPSGDGEVGGTGGQGIIVITYTPWSGSTECASGASSGFQEPNGGSRVGSNAGLFLTTGLMPQEKGACEDGVTGLGLGADFFTAVSQLCLGPTNCIAEWWPTLAQPSSCKLEVRRVRGTIDTFGANLTTQLCDDKLTAAAKNPGGWVATGVDRCDGGLCDSSSYAGCVYTRMVCTGGVTVSLPTKSASPEAHPVSGLTYTPQCNDGIDNDGIGGIDYPADVDCIGYWDDSES